MSRKKRSRPEPAIAGFEPRGSDDPEQINSVIPRNYNQRQLLDYANVKALAAELNRPAKTLIAMGPNTDPFCIVPGRRRGAEWFAGLWKRFGGFGAHIRRIHYKIISQKKPVKMPNGRLYRNTRR